MARISSFWRLEGRIRLAFMGFESWPAFNRAERSAQRKTPRACARLARVYILGPEVLPA
jgi:hypothetical protein